MNSQDLKLQQTTRMLKPFEHLGEQPRPRSGWLRAIRTALGLSLRQHAARADLNYGTLFDAEKSEARETITLAQLRKLADKLDCKLVYAIVPRRPLRDVIRERAEARAREEIGFVVHTMSLEAQRPSREFIARQVADRCEQLLSGPRSRLWSQPRPKKPRMPKEK